MGINLPETKSEANSFESALQFSQKEKPTEARLKPLVKTDEWDKYINNQIVPSYNTEKDDFTSVYNPNKKELSVDFKVSEIDSSVADSLVFSIKELLKRHQLLTRIINVINGLDVFDNTSSSQYNYNLIEGTIIYDIKDDDRKLFVAWHSYDLTRINIEITPNDDNRFDLFTIDTNPSPTIMRRDEIDPTLLTVATELSKIICK